MASIRGSSDESVIVPVILAANAALQLNKLIAKSYKTQPNAVMEDLLKKLPGVDVDSDGKITSGGKQVTKILVDGKEF